MRAQLDAYGQDTTAHDTHHLAEILEEALAQEILFHDAGYETDHGHLEHRAGTCPTVEEKIETLLVDNPRSVFSAANRRRAIGGNNA